MIEAKSCWPNKNKSADSTQDPEAHGHVKAGPDGKRKSTYGYKADNQWLAERHIENRIIKRAYRNKPLDKTVKPNPLWCTVERVFGVLKQRRYGESPLARS